MSLRQKPLAGAVPSMGESKLRQLLQDVMNLASGYSHKGSPAMLARDAALHDIAELLRAIVGSAAASLGLDRLSLDVQYGGRRGSYGPVPWVRMFSKLHAPSAQEGYYLAYLFAADGSRVYLSLMQGTSELRAGKRRPVQNRELIYSRSAEARSLLRGVAGAAFDAMDTSIVDLGLSGIPPVGSESRDRIRNYEAGTIVARCYGGLQVLTGDVLLRDIIEMLTLLAYLHREPVMQGSFSPVDSADAELQKVIEESGRSVAKLRQGRLMDPIVRKLVEVHAEGMARAELVADGWHVQQVGQYKRGYDLDCWQDNGRALHVEVKGTRSCGREVVLTPNEVSHSQSATGCAAEHALYVASEIQIIHDAGLRAAGGRGRWFWPWEISQDELIPTEYAYRPPVKPATHASRPSLSPSGELWREGGRAGGFDSRFLD
ncbi:MrcB family domain-containing protein [Micromonospora citrea]